MNVITVVKYKVKDGFEQKFVDAINAYDYSNSISMRLISLPDNEYMSIMEYEEIDKTSADEETGVNCLDSAFAKYDLLHIFGWTEFTQHAIISQT